MNQKEVLSIRYSSTVAGLFGVVLLCLSGKRIIRKAWCKIFFHKPCA